MFCSPLYPVAIHYRSSSSLYRYVHTHLCKAHAGDVLSLHPCERWLFILSINEKLPHPCGLLLDLEILSIHYVKRCPGEEVSATCVVNSVGECFDRCELRGVGMRSFCASPRYIPYVKNPRGVTQYFCVHLSGFVYA